MKLWLIEQSTNNGYDTYSDAVVVANTEHDARHTHPGGGYTWGVWITDRGKLETWGRERDNGSHYTEGLSPTWALPDAVSVTLLGVAEDPTPRVVCASFHAG